MAIRLRQTDKALEAELSMLRGMQKEWDDYTMEQLGVTYTDLYHSRRQARDGDTICLAELVERLAKRETPA